MSEAVAPARQERPPLSLMPHSAARSAYRADFDRLKTSSFHSEPDWLSRLRDSGMHAFESLGFPTMKDEDWHFTSVAPIADRIFHVAEPSQISAEIVTDLVFPKLAGPVFVFVNGFFASDLSSRGSLSGNDEAVSLQTLADAIRDDSTGAESLLGSVATVGSAAFTALNSAFFTDGALIRVAADAVVEAPIHLVFISSDNEGAVSHPRNLIVAGRNSRATVIESSLGGAISSITS